MRGPPQPSLRRADGLPLISHKFKLGETLIYLPSAFEAATRKGNYRVVRLLPAEGSDHQYLVKSEADGHERVVRESQLR